MKTDIGIWEAGTPLAEPSGKDGIRRISHSSRSSVAIRCWNAAREAVNTRCKLAVVQVA